MITKKRVKREVEVVDIVKKYVTVYEMDGREYANREEAMEAAEEKIGHEMWRLLKHLTSSSMLCHGPHQTMQTLAYKMKYRGGKHIACKETQYYLNNIMQLIKDYEGMGQHE